MNNELQERSLHDEEFAEYLQRGSEFSRRYRELGGQAVPRALDAKILERARQHSAARARRSGSWVRWSAPLAVAASALIAMSVVMQPDVQQAAAPNGTHLLDSPAQPLSNTASSVADPLLAPRPEADVQALSAELSGSARADAQPADTVQGVPGNLSKRENYEGGETRNYATYNPQVARDDQFLIGQREPSAGGKIAPYRSESALVLSSTNVNRERIYIQQPPVAASGYSSQVMDPHAVHSEVPRENRADAKAGESIEVIPATPGLPSAPKSVDTGNVSSDDSKVAAAKMRATAAVLARAPPPLPAAPPLPVAALAIEAEAVAPVVNDVAPAPAQVLADRQIAPQALLEQMRKLRAQGNSAAAALLWRRLRAAHPDFPIPREYLPPEQQQR